MGVCFSYETTDNRKPCAHVVSVNGQLRQYPVPVTVSEVLQSETSSPDKKLFFVCNSDRLYFNEYIPVLDSHEELKPAQIYFVLPISKLKYRLAASDMAALAVKASVALEQINRRSRNRTSKIAPVMVVDEDDDLESNLEANQTKISSFGSNHYISDETKATAKIGLSRSGSVRKVSKYSSRRAKLAVRSFRIKLNTIYEGSVMLN